MKRLLDYGNAYAKSSTWKDFALVKFCLCSLGIIIGCLIPEKWHKKVLTASGIIFIATYLPLIGKLIVIICAKQNDSETTENAV